MELLNLAKLIWEYKEQRILVQSFFAKIRYFKDKVACWNSAITEFNALKNIKFSIFRM